MPENCPAAKHHYVNVITQQYPSLVFHCSLFVSLLAAAYRPSMCILQVTSNLLSSWKSKLCHVSFYIQRRQRSPVC